MTPVTYEDRPPPGWFILAVMRRKKRSRDWAALMVDIDPDSDNFRQATCPPRNCWVRIAGKHSCEDSAWEALQDMMVTRH